MCLIYYSCVPMRGCHIENFLLRNLLLEWELYEQFTALTPVLFN